MKETVSKNSFKIRLTDERWLHITLGHPELADYYFEILETIKNPLIVYEGENNELIAAKEIEANKYMVVVYKELESDGFIITAYLTNKIQKFNKKKVLWEQKK